MEGIENTSYKRALDKYMNDITVPTSLNDTYKSSVLDKLGLAQYKLNINNNIDDEVKDILQSIIDVLFLNTCNK